jgi:3-oxoacyl-[acyl-carrier-protein] synthase III
VLAAAFGNDGALRGSVFLAHPGLTGQAEQILFTASNQQMSEHVVDLFRRIAHAVLESAGLTMEQVDWLVPHQPNGSLLEKVVQMFGIPADKVVSVVREIGSVGSASMAVGLDRLLRTRNIAPGSKILLAGLGAGLSYGAMLYQVAPSTGETA